MQKIRAIHKTGVLDVLMWPPWNGVIGPNVVNGNNSNHTMLTSLIELSDVYERNVIEDDPNYIQLIPFGIVCNDSPRRILLVKRASSEEYGEKRLRGRWSIGLGGHWEEEDGTNPIDCLKRELMEEINLDIYNKHEVDRVEYKGLIYLHGMSMVNAVHMGIMYHVHIESFNFPYINADFELNGEHTECLIVNRDGMNKFLDNKSNITEDWFDAILPLISKDMNWDIFK